MVNSSSGRKRTGIFLCAEKKGGKEQSETRVIAGGGGKWKTKKKIIIQLPTLKITKAIDRCLRYIRKEDMR